MHISRQDESVVDDVNHHQDQLLANTNNNTNGTPANIDEPSQDSNLHSGHEFQRLETGNSQELDHQDNNSSSSSNNNSTQSGTIRNPGPPAAPSAMINQVAASSLTNISTPPPPPQPPLSPSGTAAATAAAAATARITATHMASIHSLHPQLDLKLNARFMLMPANDQIRELQTVLRDKATCRGNFKFYADRLIRLVVEEGLNQLPIEKVDVQTPTGNVFHGIRYLKGNCGVSIVRSGESMEQGLRDCCRSIRIGKILIESDENNQARVLYAKVPKDIAQRKILLLYPIMSTGLAVIESVKVLLSYGAREENLILLTLFSSPRAAKIINNSFPNMFALTSDINSVCPNHFGQRYFGTD